MELKRDGRGDKWQWKIITSRAIPFVSREETKTRDAAWSDARKQLAELVRDVMTKLEAAEEAAQS